jgi:VIT1/CCC1 family predicted Fe2+/Mn2+ transporter
MKNVERWVEYLGSHAMMSELDSETEEVVPDVENVEVDLRRRFDALAQHEQLQVLDYGLYMNELVKRKAIEVEGGAALREASATIDRLTTELSTSVEVAAQTGRAVARSELADQLTLLQTENGTLRDRLEFAEQSGREREDALRSEMQGRIDGLYGKLEAAAGREGDRKKSTVRGEIGERYVEDLLLELFPTADISDQRRSRGRGDFVITLGNVHMMLEVKNYTKNVTKSEITKFERDMNRNAEYTCGILASLVSGVCGKEDYSLEVVNNRPVLYLHRLTADPNALRSAMRLFELMHSLENVNLSKLGVIDQIKTELASRRHRITALRGMAERHCEELKELITKEDEATTAALEMVISGCS